MIHPDTELKTANKEKGRGVFATAFIPKGTVTYVKDPLEIEVMPGDPRLNNSAIKENIETYSYIDAEGVRIISWDHAKYVNHCCRCNTMSTGYGFEIAIRDIEAGEEITDEYGMFNFEYTLNLHCEKSPCRGTVSGSDLDRYHEEWDREVQSALASFGEVDQPLAELIDDRTLDEVRRYLDTGKGYRSVLSLKASGRLNRS